MLDADVCYRALLTRDDRFDGRMFVGVVSTGVYCRPVCRVRAPKRANCRFFPSAAAAQEAGFRPCLRCRPETAPELASSRGTTNTVARGLALIADGALDGDRASVQSLAERLGVGERQLRRLFRTHLGASPVAVAQTRRVLFAKQLIDQTDLPLGEIAFAAGFTSVRRFNETFAALFSRPPSALRREARRALDPAEPTVAVRLRYRPPYDWDAMLAHLAARAIDGVERIVDDQYSRTIRGGVLTVAHAPHEACLVVTVRTRELRELPAIVARVRRLFDLSADAPAIAAHLRDDPCLARSIEAHPGLRVPGAWDGFELAVRAILGQQVSIASARRLGSELVATAGPRASDAGFRAVFPTPRELLDADLSKLRVPRARTEALRAIAAAAAADPALFLARASLDRTVATLRAIRGVGEWTAQYIALRAARDPDAFPASDAALLRAHRRATGSADPRELLARAERWRPWRGYAAQHLWTLDASASG